MSAIPSSLRRAVAARSLDRLTLLSAVPFTKELLQDIMLLVQTHYRALTGPNNTAIAGLSAGGAQALPTGLAHMEVFHYVVPAMGADHADAFRR